MGNVDVLRCFDLQVLRISAWNVGREFVNWNTKTIMIKQVYFRVYTACDHEEDTV